MIKQQGVAILDIVLRALKAAFHKLLNLYCAFVFRPSLPLLDLD